MRLNSIKQIQPALVFVGILIAIPSGLLFHNQSCAICSCRTPSFLFISGKTLLMVPAREMVVASDGYKYNVNPCSGKRRSIDSRRGPSCHFSAWSSYHPPKSCTGPQRGWVPQLQQRCQWWATSAANNTGCLCVAALVVHGTRTRLDGQGRIRMIHTEDREDQRRVRLHRCLCGKGKAWNIQIY